ncbi:MAG: hypothetical protein QY322_04320 [bacterium]|nr:MAG: hypothetical protein QY322_04320 [bacterium]
MVTYLLIPERNGQDLTLIIKKISDYLISFTGDISVKTKSEKEIEIIYTNTSFSAELAVRNSKLTLLTHPDDSITINLVKNIAANSGFRVFNKNGFFLPNDPKLMDVSSVGINERIYKIFKSLKLKPIFQYKDSLIFFCLNQKKEVVLINRHYIEYLIENHETPNAKELAVTIAPDIATFIALFDRGLISLVFPKYLNNDTKVVNLSGFDISNLPNNSLLQVTNFRLNKEKQNFIQESTTDKIINKKYLAMKINQDYSYKLEGKKLIKIINVSCFYEA